MEKRYNVVQNHQGQFSIWSSDKDTPEGWVKTGIGGTKDECLRNIEEVWVDIRPQSLLENLKKQEGIVITKNDSIRKHEEMIDTYRKRYTYDLDSWSNYDYLKDCIQLLFTKHIRENQDKTVFEIGVGSGVSSEFILKSGFQLTGIDVIEHKNWKPLQEKYGTNFNPFVQDILKLEGETLYDIVLDNGCFHHFEPELYAPTLSKVNALLAPKGRFFLAVFEDESDQEEGLVSYLDGGKRRCKFFTQNEITKLLNENAFELVAKDRVSRDFDEVKTLLCICEKMVNE